MPERIVSSILVVFTFCLLVLGGVVHSTGSSLACPDWPTCYGSFLPRMTGGIRFEHSHRILAGMTALLTLALVALLRARASTSRRLARSGYLALALVIVQASLGGATVLLRLPPVVSEAHLLVGTTFFSVTLWLAWTIRRQTTPRLFTTSQLHRVVRIALALAFVQIQLGGLVRHTGSSLVCPAFPGCLPDSWFAGGQALGLVHMAHRLGAFVLTIAVSGLVAIAWRRRAPGLRTFALGGLVLLVAQIALGVGSVTSSLATTIVVPHFAVGLLLFAVLAVFDFWLGGTVRPAGPTAHDHRHPSSCSAVLSLVPFDANDRPHAP